MTQTMFSDKEVDAIANMVIDNISRSNGFSTLVNRAVCYNNYDNESFDRLLDNVLIALEHLDMIAEYDNRPRITDDRRSLIEGIGHSLKLAVCDFICADEEINRNLNDTDYNRVAEHAEAFYLALDDVNNGKLSPQFTRNQNTRHSTYGRGQPRGGRQVAVGYNRNSRANTALTSSRRRMPESSNRHGVSRAQYKNPAHLSVEQVRAPRYATRGAPAVAPQPIVAPVAPTNATVEKVIEVKSARKTNINVNNASCDVFNPTTHELFYVESGNKYVEKIDVRSKEVEPYSAHELGVSPYNLDSGNGRVISPVDLLNIPPLGDDDNIRESNEIQVNDTLLIEAAGFKPNLTTKLDKVSSNFNYTITPIRNVYTLKIPTAILDSLTVCLKDNKTFNDWKQSLDQLKGLISPENNTCGLLTSFISIIDERLKDLINNLLSIVIGVKTQLQHFQKDFDECWDYINLPKNAKYFTAWQDCQRPLIEHGIKVVDIKEDKDADSGNSVVVFENQIIYVNALGEIPQDTFVFSKRNLIANVEYSQVPEFYTACDRVISYRNNHIKMAQVILSDSFNNNYLILAGQSGETRIRASYLSN